MNAPFAKTPESVERLIVDLKDADESVRACAALNLGSLGEVAAVPALLGLLRGGKVIDRRVAALALGKIGASEAVHALLDTSEKDKNPGVRQLAFEALQNIAPVANKRAA